MTKELKKLTAERDKAEQHLANLWSKFKPISEQSCAVLIRKLHLQMDVAQASGVCPTMIEIRLPSGPEQEPEHNVLDFCGAGADVKGPAEKVLDGFQNVGLCLRELSDEQKECITLQIDEAISMLEDSQSSLFSNIDCLKGQLESYREVYKTFKDAGIASGDISTKFNFVEKALAPKNE